MTATLLGESCTKLGRASLAEKPKVEELQMDWLRSEDLKEEEDVTAPTFSIAGYLLRRSSRTDEAYHWGMQLEPEHGEPCPSDRSLPSDMLLREEPDDDEEEEEEEEHNSNGDDDGDEGYSE